MPKRYSFDERCYELAEYFYPGAPRELLDELAQRFQDQVEGSNSAELDAWQERDTQARCAPSYDMLADLKSRMSK